MTHKPAQLTTSDAQRLAQAFGLLQQGQMQAAARIADDIAHRIPHSPDALHLVALCSKSMGNMEGAAASFEAAVALAPSNASLLNNYANFLRQQGEAARAIELYRTALRIAPDHADGWMNLGIALTQAGHASDALPALEHAVQLRPRHAVSWRALGSARRSTGDLEGAQSALRRAVEFDPNDGAAWVSLGVVTRLLGDPAESLQCYSHARSVGFAGPEIDDAEASARLDLGETHQALQLTRRTIEKFPAYVPAYPMLAQILWEHGEHLSPHESPATSFSRAVEAQPRNDELRSAFVKFLLESQATEEALRQIRILREGRDDATFVVLEGHALDRNGRLAEAIELLDGTSDKLSTNAAFADLHVRLLLKTGDPGRAASVALGAVERNPRNQSALAFLGIAWRLLSDPREEWLCGYDRLVASMEVPLPESFPDLAGFLDALQATLLPMHVARREPVNQSVRGGSQTSGNLFGRRDPVLVAMRAAMRAAIEKYVTALPDDSQHPFLRCKENAVRFAGAWSVRLWSSGRHVNHFHQNGWISSAFHVALPPSVLRSSGDSSEGWLQFGAPPSELGLDLSPRRLVRPEPGRLVLFPSYLLHGTVPFSDPEPRLTVAFDAVPASEATRRLDY
ncbi:Tfp pilus assembly protein PilF [Povalibacter uvarum]|uniref:Tfp pilus assembly protein PilF n=1 Tax=Povalibacter uvarum TaxID=732238 RepID=A0A841HT00_9GAMM|nr:tetratricopeptide repeat protein [Povalibacter uvarum]MBB6096531.1 Tfp pilus assembly protein PilF [Povalibacter uvarum]